MGMVFCRGCGKEIHETALTCPNCGAPQSVQKPQVTSATNASSELDSISNAWKIKFELIEKAGGVKLPNAKSLQLGELMKVSSNVWGFLFGPFYYLAKGMWKKAVSLLGISLLVIVVLEVICRVMGFSDLITNFVAPAIFASRANIDFYKKVKLGENGWW